MRTILREVFPLIAASTLQSQDRRALCSGQERNLRRSRSHTLKRPTTSKRAAGQPWLVRRVGEPRRALGALLGVEVGAPVLRAGTGSPRPLLLVLGNHLCLYEAYSDLMKI